MLSVFVIFQTPLATGRAIHGHRPRFQMAYRGQLTRILRTAHRGSISSPTANSTNTDICFVDAALDFGFVDGVGVSKACAIYGSVAAACRSVPQWSALLLSRLTGKRWFRVFVASILKFCLNVIMKVDAIYYWYCMILCHANRMCDNLHKCRLGYNCIGVSIEFANVFKRWFYNVWRFHTI